MEYTEYIKLYDDNCVFNNCNCPPNEKIPYSIIHQQKPLPLPGLLLDVIEMPLKVFPKTKDYLEVVRAFNVIHGFLDDESEENEAKKENDLDKAKN